MMTIKATISDKDRVYNGTNAAELLQEIFDDSKIDQIKLLQGQITTLSDRGQFPKKFQLVVDGKLSDNLKSVKNLGRIEAVGVLPTNVALTQLYDMIVAASPVDTGVYKRYNVVYRNGKIVASNASQLNAYLKSNELGLEDKIVFANITPYARRLEYKGVFGKITGDGSQLNLKFLRVKRKVRRIGRGLSQITASAAPNGAYYHTSKKAVRLLRQLDIKFRWASGKELNIISPIEGPKQKYRTTFAKGNKHQIGKDYIYPTIVVNLRIK